MANLLILRTGTGGLEGDLLVDTPGVPESNTELAREGFAVYNEAGLEGFIEFLSSRELLHSDFLFEIQEDLPNGGLWQGLEGFREMSRQWLEAWEEFSIEPLELTEGRGGDVLAEVEQRAVARGSGMEISGRGFFYVLVFRDGKVASMHLLMDGERARELAGLGG